MTGSAEAGEPTAEKRVGWAELFFDLVFVLAVTRVSAVLEDDHTWSGVGHALVVFVPIYWLWVGTAIQTNLQDANRPGVRIRVFAIALAGIFMALALPDAYGDLGLLFAFAYWFGRLALGLGVVIDAARARRWPINPYTVSIVLTGPMLVIGGLLHGNARLAVWAVAAIVDLASPTVLQRWLRAMHYDAGHLTERFGLFVLIALGESVVAVGSSAGGAHLTVTQGVAIAVAFVLSCGLWWVYFHFAADAMRHSLATARVQLDVTRLVLSYGHLALIAAIIFVAVGLHEAIHGPEHHLDAGVAAVLVGGCALYLASFGFTRWAMFRLVSWTRLTAALAVLVILPVAPHIPALATLVALAVVLIALNAVEYTRVNSIGWRARRGSTVR